MFFTFCLPRSYHTQNTSKKFFCTHHQKKNPMWIVPKLLKYKHLYFCHWDYFASHTCLYFLGLASLKICVIVFPVRLWLNDLLKKNIVWPNTSNTLGVVRVIGIGKRVETKSLSTSPTINQSKKFHDFTSTYFGSISLIMNECIFGFVW